MIWRKSTGSGPARAQRLRHELGDDRMQGQSDHARTLQVTSTSRSGHEMEERRVVLLEAGAELLLRLAVDLADAALGDTHHLADLGHREVLDVEEDGDLALALGQLAERLPEAVLRVGAQRRGLRVGANVV